MDEPTLLKTPSALLRLSHAEHFKDQYLLHSGPPVDSYWLMIGYFDAFLFSLASIFDMASTSIRDQLSGIEVFRFFKALRNVTAHHSVLAAAVAGNKFPRPFSREVNVSVGAPQSDSSRLFLRLDILRSILDAIELERPKERKNLDVARAYIVKLESRNGRTYLEDLMSEALSVVKAVVPHV